MIIKNINNIKTARVLKTLNRSSLCRRLEYGIESLNFKLEGPEYGPSFHELPFKEFESMVVGILWIVDYEFGVESLKFKKVNKKKDRKFRYNFSFCIRTFSSLG